MPVVADAAEYAATIEGVGGPAALAQWKRLEKAMKPLQKGAALFPAAAIRCALCWGVCVWWLGRPGAKGWMV